MEVSDTQIGTPTLVVDHGWVSASAAQQVLFPNTAFFSASERSWKSTECVSGFWGTCIYCPWISRSSSHKPYGPRRTTISVSSTCALHTHPVMRSVMLCERWPGEWSRACWSQVMSQSLFLISAFIPATHLLLTS